MSMLDVLLDFRGIEQDKNALYMADYEFHIVMTPGHCFIVSFSFTS